MQKNNKLLFISVFFFMFFFDFVQTINTSFLQFTHYILSRAHCWNLIFCKWMKIKKRFVFAGSSKLNVLLSVYGRKESDIITLRLKIICVAQFSREVITFVCVCFDEMMILEQICFFFLLLFLIHDALCEKWKITFLFFSSTTHMYRILFLSSKDPFSFIQAWFFFGNKSCDTQRFFISFFLVR